MRRLALLAACAVASASHAAPIPIRAAAEAERAKAVASSRPAIPPARAALSARPAPAATRAAVVATDQLAEVRGRILTIERGLIDGMQSRDQAKTNLKRMSQLIQLQRQEREIGKRRMTDLEATVAELESRRAQLKKRIFSQQASIRRSLIALDRAGAEFGTTDFDPESERLEAPRRKVLGLLVDRGLKEIEAYRVDLADATALEDHIQEEKGQLAYLFQDLQEREGVLELNRQLQADILKKQHEERLAQLTNYRKLKDSETQVSRMIGEFNARLELERANEAERVVSKAMAQGAFGKRKGALPLPVAGGRVISSFGRAYDPKSRLYVFKKGVDIAADKLEQVKAVAPGKIVYSGELPEYGRVAIVDHGEHFYSLCAHLGELKKGAGESVVAGDVIGSTDEAGTPVYFEIRARNVAVNPAQWMADAR